MEDLVRVGECDGCVGRHESAYCCTTINAGDLFGRLDDASRAVLNTPSRAKTLHFIERMPYDMVRFYRLHGLDGSVDLSLFDEDGGESKVRVAIRTRGMRITSPAEFTMLVPPAWDMQVRVALPCRAYDFATRKCTIYDTRPDICRDFPVLPEQVENTPCAYKFVRKGFAGAAR